MFERFTERARQVVVLAQDEARAFKHDYIGTEHILLGLLREEEGLAARVLESLDVTVEEVRARVTRAAGVGDVASTGQIPFTVQAKETLEGGLEEALAMGHGYIGTEHVLLGLLRQADDVAVGILRDLDADPAKIRAELVRLLTRPAQETARARVVRAAAPRARMAFPPAFFVGWVSFALAFGIGVLVGWVIWA